MRASSRYESFAPVSTHVRVGAPSSSTVATGTPRASSTRNSVVCGSEAGSRKPQNATLEVDREWVQAEQVASDETVERCADQARELVRVESERALVDIAIPPSPLDAPRVREARRRASVEQETRTRISDEVSVQEFESNLGHEDQGGLRERRTGTVESVASGGTRPTSMVSGR